MSKHIGLLVHRHARTEWLNTRTQTYEETHQKKKSTKKENKKSREGENLENEKWGEEECL